MKTPDNFKIILQSLTPIKYTYSKMNKEFNVTFKNKSLKNLLKNLNFQYKVKDEFSPSPAFLKNKNKLEINFKKSNEYIKELSNLKNTLLLNKNNYIYNDDFKFNSNNKEERPKTIEVKKRIEKDIFNKRLKKLQFFKIINLRSDSLNYNPNYDSIKKKVYSVYIRPPSPFKNINQANEVNKENEKYNNEKNKSLSMNTNNIIFQKYNLHQSQSRNLNNNTLDKNKRENKCIFFNNYNQNINNNSIIFKESLSNQSNSNKNQFIESNNSNYNHQYSSIDNLKLNSKLLNLKHFINQNHKNRIQKIKSDYFTMDVNKSTNLEDINSIFIDKEKLYKSNSLRNETNKKLRLKKLKKIFRRNIIKNRSEGNNGIKNSIYFKKMIGRKSVHIGGKLNNYISYNPKYEFIRPHIQSSFFCFKNNDEDDKKYKIGKIIRSYNYSPDQYFVFEPKPKKPIIFDINREMQKILEILKNQTNNIA